MKNRFLQLLQRLAPTVSGPAPSVSETAKYRVLVAGVVVLVFLLGQQVVASVGDRVDRMVEKAGNQLRVHQRVTDLAAQLTRVRSQGSGSKKGADGPKIASLMSWLEKETGRAELSENIRQIAPIPLQAADSGLFREKATLGLRDIPMERVLRFLQRLESVSTLRIVRLDLKRPGKNGQGVLITLEIGLL